MRSQILTPVLCFLLATFCTITPSFSATKLVNLKAKESSIETVTSLKKNLNTENISAIAVQTKTPENTPENKGVNSERQTGYQGEKTSFKENSYKNNMVTASENSISETVSNASQKAEVGMFQKGMFYGFTAMVILLNLVCFFLFEEKNYLWYALTLASITITFMFGDNLFPYLGITGIENGPAMQTSLLLIATICSAIFASKYLLVEEFFPKLKWIASSLITLAFLSTFIGWVSEATFATGIANAALLSVFALYFSAGVALFSKKNYVKFYVIAFAIPLLFSLDFFVLKNMGINFLFTESIHLKGAIVIEMLIITYAVMYRMGAIKEEHVLRQTEMRIFLQRQEVINRSNTEKIMQDMYLENLIMQYDLDGLEIKLLQYISEGKDNAKIARKLKTTELEIEEFTKELYFKLDIGEQIKEDYRMVETQPDYIYN